MTQTIFFSVSPACEMTYPIENAQAVLQEQVNYIPLIQMHRELFDPTTNNRQQLTFNRFARYSRTLSNADCVQPKQAPDAPKAQLVQDTVAHGVVVPSSSDTGVLNNKDDGVLQSERDTGASNNNDDVALQSQSDTSTTNGSDGAALQ